MIGRLNVRLALAPLASVTVAVNVSVPAFIDIPLKIPLKLMVKPGGGDPVRDQISAPVPPDAVSCSLQNALRKHCATGSGPIAGAALTVRVRVAEAVVFVLSVTVTVKEEVAAIVGVPVRSPLEVSERPAGGLPDHVYGAMPPVTESCSV